jgi:hypothetical protein
VIHLTRPNSMRISVFFRNNNDHSHDHSHDMSWFYSTRLTCSWPLWNDNNSLVVVTNNNLPMPCWLPRLEAPRPPCWKPGDPPGAVKIASLISMISTWLSHLNMCM